MNADDLDRFIEELSSENAVRVSQDVLNFSVHFAEVIREHKHDGTEPHEVYPAFFNIAGNLAELTMVEFLDMIEAGESVHAGMFYLMIKFHNLMAAAYCLGREQKYEIWTPQCEGSD